MSIEYHFIKFIKSNLKTYQYTGEQNAFKNNIISDKNINATLIKLSKSYKIAKNSSISYPSDFMSLQLAQLYYIFHKVLVTSMFWGLSIKLLVLNVILG